MKITAADLQAIERDVGIAGAIISVELGYATNWLRVRVDDRFYQEVLTWNITKIEMVKDEVFKCFANNARRYLMDSNITVQKENLNGTK